MKRFLIFKSGYGGNDNEATELYIGEFDAAEDIVHDVARLRKETYAIDELNVQILDTSEGLWYTYRLFPLEPDFKDGKFRRQYDEYITSLQALTKKVPPLRAVRRFVLFGLPEHDRSGGPDEILASFDTTEECVVALAKAIERIEASGWTDTLTPRWYRLTNDCHWLDLLDLQTDSRLIVRWESYDPLRKKTVYLDEYRKFLEFDQRAKRTMADFDSVSQPAT